MIWCWRFPHFGTVSDARAKIPNYISDWEFCVISALSDFAGNIPKLHKNWETYGDTVGLRVSKSKRFRSEVGGATEVQIGRGRIYRGEEAQGSNRHVAWLMWRVLQQRGWDGIEIWTVSSNKNSIRLVNVWLGCFLVGRFGQALLITWASTAEIGRCYWCDFLV